MKNILISGNCSWFLTDLVYLKTYLCPFSFPKAVFVMQGSQQQCRTWTIAYFRGSCAVIPGFATSIFLIDVLFFLILYLSYKVPFLLLSDWSHCLFSEPLDTKTVWSKSPVVTCGLKAITMDTVSIVMLLGRWVNLCLVSVKVACQRSKASGTQ